MSERDSWPEAPELAAAGRAGRSRGGRRGRGRNRAGGGTGRGAAPTTSRLPRMSRLPRSSPSLTTSRRLTTSRQPTSPPPRQHRRRPSTPRATRRFRTATACCRAAADGERRAVGVVVSRFNGDVTSKLLDGRPRRARERRGRPRGDHGHAGPGRVRAADRGHGAGEDPPLRLHRGARLCDPRRHAALRLRRRRGRVRLQLAALETGVPVAFGLLTLEQAEQADDARSTRAPKRSAPAWRWPTCLLSSAPRRSANSPGAVLDGLRAELVFVGGEEVVHAVGLADVVR